MKNQKEITKEINEKLKKIELVSKENFLDYVLKQNFINLHKMDNENLFLNPDLELLKKYEKELNERN